MHKLLEYVCEKLDELEFKLEKDGKLSMAEIEYGDVLARFKKNLLKSAEMMGEEEEYSMAGGSYAYARGGGGGGRSDRGGGSSNRGGSNRGGSYAGGGRGGQSGNAYARGRGRNARRDSMGRYSGEEGYSGAEEMDEMIETIREMMPELPSEVQRDAEKFVQKLETVM